MAPLTSAHLPRVVAAALVVTASLAGCGQPAMIDELAPDSTCRRITVEGPRRDVDDSLRERLAVRWLLPDDDDEIRRLNAWCAGVGPAVVGGWASASDTAAAPSQTTMAAAAPDTLPESTDDAASPSPPPPPPPPVDSLAVVSWNVHIGAGALRQLVEDLRAGRLTGRGPVEHFVLLLQEAYRGGAGVPPFDADLPGGSGEYAGPPDGVREDIVRDAEALGLDVFYAPSMRNGEGEDRGNAILSTLPLHDHVAIPLPIARQRRVAIGATIEGQRSDGEAWRLQVASVHLESDASGLANDAAERMRQARVLLDRLPDADAAIAAGDFNTRRPDGELDLVNTMRQAYPDTPPFPPGPTYIRGFGFLRLYLDYIFFRLPDDARARYDRAPDLYGSDHFPLVGWVVLSGGA